MDTDCWEVLGAVLESKKLDFDSSRPDVNTDKSDDWDVFSDSASVPLEIEVGISVAEAVILEENRDSEMLDEDIEPPQVD